MERNPCTIKYRIDTETTEPTPEAVKSSPIREDLARRAHEMISHSDYREGSVTAEYNALCKRAVEIAETQKKKVDPMYHYKIDALLASYVRRMADNINHRNEIGTTRTPERRSRRKLKPGNPSRTP